jgi:hypothetical protein
LDLRLLGLNHLHLRLRLNHLHLRLRLSDSHLRRRHAHDDLGLRDVDGHRRRWLSDQDLGLPLPHSDLRLGLLNRDLWGGLLDAHRRGRLLDDNAITLVAFLGRCPSLPGRSWLRCGAPDCVTARLLVALLLQGSCLLEGNRWTWLRALFEGRHQTIALRTSGRHRRLVHGLGQRRRDQRCRAQQDGECREFHLCRVLN